ncbi:transcriptional initiation protein Tat [Halobellus sp. EA9]|uniref:transcriptional initiation protein Tat n=1 Tax=Halobellus sp. EA9 TaxID=3421647 RepID=UPI003EB726CB
MDRRTVLAAATGSLSALLGGCLGAAPGATGPRHPPDAPAGEPRRTTAPPPLGVGTFDFEATDAGDLRVFGTVRNRSEAERTATVTVTVGLGEEEFEREASLAVPAGETAEWSVTFDVAYERFTTNGNLSVDVA